MTEKDRVLAVVKDILADFPPHGLIERQAVKEFLARIDRLTEEQCAAIVSRVREHIL